MPFRSEKQRRYLWANEPKIAREWTDEYGSKPVKAKKGKYQDFKHPQHDILPLEHMEEKVSSKERVEKLLDDRKKKKESKKKLAKDGPHYVPGWKPNLSVKAAEGELVRQKTQGTGAAIKGIEHYTMKGMPTAQAGQLIQTPTRGTGAAVKGTDHYVMQGMDAAKTGKLIKAKESKWILKDDKSLYGHKIEKRPSSKWEKSLKNIREIYKIAKENKKEDRLTIQDLENARKVIKSRELVKVDPGATLAAKGKMIKAKKGLWAGAATDMYDKPPGWDVKKISDKTHKKLTKLWKHREAGGWSPAAGKRYKEHLKGLKKATTKPSKFMHRRATLGAAKALGIGIKIPETSKFMHRRATLGAAKTLGIGSMQRPPKFSRALKAIGKRTAIGKAVAAATVVAGAYEAGKRKLFTKDKKKKKIDKKSIGGETVVMKSGGGYIDDLL